MNSSLLPFFQWCESTAVGHAIKQSLWLFPVVESIHLLGLAVLGGALLVVDLRMLGLGLRSQPIGMVAREARPWLLASLGVMLLTGLPLPAGEHTVVYDYAPMSFRIGAMVTAVTWIVAVAATVVARRRGAAPRNPSVA